MPPNVRRFLPLIIVGFFLIFLLPTLLKKKSTSGLSSGARATQTINAMNLIDKGEQAYKSAHSRYTEHVADVITPTLADDLALGLAVDLNVSTDGQTYYARVASDVLSVLRARQGDKQIADSCAVIKSSKGVNCPAPPVAPGAKTTTK